MLARHLDIGYFNHMNHRLRGKPLLSHLLTPYVDRKDKPKEAQRIWDQFKKRDDDVLTSEDANLQEAYWLNNLIKKVLMYRQANRFLAKYPRLSLRVPWLDFIFPDALFIHMTRDWRAVTSSMVLRRVKREKRGGGWFGVHTPGWRDILNESHVVVSARIFRHTSLMLEAEKVRIGERFLTIAYEDLCKNPSTTLKSITDFCGLTFDDAFLESIPDNFISSNYKWRETLDLVELDAVRSEAPDFYSRYEEG
jgi:hypothetical protein